MQISSFFSSFLVPLLIRLWKLKLMLKINSSDGPQSVSSVAQSCPILCDPMDCSTPGLPVHHQLPEFTQTHVLSQWCHPIISSSVVPFSHLQYFSASGSFPVNQFFTSSGQSIGVSASASVLPKNIKDWFPLRWTGWIFLLSKGLSRVSSNGTI